MWDRGKVQPSNRARADVRGECALDEGNVETQRSKHGRVEYSGKATALVGDRFTAEQI
jgi:hypothetical protein